MKKAITIFALAGGLLLLMMAAINNKHENAKRAEVEVWMMQPVSRVKGFAWPAHSDGKPFEIAAVEDSRNLKLHLPSNREINLPAKAITFHQDNGSVTEVSALPLGDLTDFQQAAAEASALAANLKADGDENFRAKLESWRAQKNPASDAFSNFGASTELERGVLLFLTLKAHPSGNGWFLVVDFTRPANSSA